MQKGQTTVPNQKFSHLGYGLGFRSCHYDEILRDRPKAIDWLEVITENFLNIGGKPRRVLEEARDYYHIAIHGVGLSIGSPEAPRQSYLKNLKSLASWLKPALISDHLCFTTMGRHNSHDLLPLHYTTSMLERVASRIERLQDMLGMRFMLENPSAYVTYASHDMPEAEFLCRLVDKTGCGILLDVNNLFVNQMNLGEDPVDYINQLPQSSVGQIHLAGHSVTTNEWGTIRIDTHDHDISSDVWNLYQIARHKWPDASPMIEWDDHIPPLKDLINTLDHARSLKPVPLLISENASFTSRSPEVHATDDGLIQLFSMATDDQGLTAEDKRLKCLASDKPVPPILGASAYNNAYFARLRDVLRSEFPTLAAVTTEDGFDEIAASYLKAHPPTAESIDRCGDNLPSHLSAREIPHVDFGVTLTVLADIANLDLARNRVFTHPDSTPTITKHVLAEITPEQWNIVKFKMTPTLELLTLRHDITPVWSATQNGLPPSPPDQQTRHVAVWRHMEESHHRDLSEGEFELLKDIMAYIPFSDAISSRAERMAKPVDEITHEVLPWLIQWFDQGLIIEVSINALPEDAPQ